MTTPVVPITPSANYLGPIKPEGNLLAIAGNPLGANAADTTDDILFGIQLPADTFAYAGKQLLIEAIGMTGSTTNNKRFKMFINPTMTGQTITNGIITGGHVTGGTPICDSGAWSNATTPNSAVGWQALAQLIKYGGSGSNTQMSTAEAILGATHAGMQAGQALTIPENAPINIVVTGSSQTTGAANDVLLQQFTVNMSP